MGARHPVIRDNQPTTIDEEREMDVDQLISNAKDAMTVKRVYGEPYERNGVTFIPAASVRAAGGGGGGQDDKGGSGDGGGFGATARPAGAYIIEGDEVRWEPAVDLNRLVATVGAMVIVWLFTRSRVTRAKAKLKAKAS